MRNHLSAHAIDGLSVSADDDADIPLYSLDFFVIINSGANHRRPRAPRRYQP